MSYGSESQLNKGHLMGYLDKDGNITKEKTPGSIKEVNLRGILWIEHGLAETYNIRVTTDEIKSKEK